VEGLRKNEGFADWLTGKKIFESIIIWHFYYSAIIEKLFGIYNHGLGHSSGAIKCDVLFAPVCNEKEKARPFSTAAIVDNLKA
jgi:hypothetical protein